jgi:hypothetical protein
MRKRISVKFKHFFRKIPERDLDWVKILVKPIDFSLVNDERKWLSIRLKTDMRKFDHQPLTVEAALFRHNFPVPKKRRTYRQGDNISSREFYWRNAPGISQKANYETRPFTTTICRFVSGRKPAFNPVNLLARHKAIYCFAISVKGTVSIKNH